MNPFHYLNLINGGGTRSPSPKYAASESQHSARHLNNGGATLLRSPNFAAHSPFGICHSSFLCHLWPCHLSFAAFPLLRLFGCGRAARPPCLPGERSFDP